VSKAAASLAAMATLAAAVPAHAADLRVAFTERAGRVATNGVARYQLQVLNRDDAAAMDVLLRFEVPAGLRHRGGPPAGCSEPAEDGFAWVECPLGRIEAHGAASAAFDLVAPERPGRFTLAAGVSGRDPDPNPADNRSTARTRVVYARGRCANSYSEESFAVDRLVGSPFGDELFGLPGDDVLVGLGATDCLYGNGGHDRLHGGGSHDLVEGGVGDDMLRGELGRDRYLAGSGDDEIHADDGRRERIRCGPGADVAVVDRRDRTRDCEVVLVRAR
jgi:hypothetical protein